ncbi:hypothetical protein WR25_07343 [Diploscapter pachys]|uniref:DOMON domain-containing protein n=1 Tax=Diploscapter pachys TaxID=2018661 RepID=A0A2A2KB36_9BILA|nr:hypothetical protein WR25_07343 [Diploscapter pachys]
MMYQIFGLLFVLPVVVYSAACSFTYDNHRVKQRVTYGVKNGTLSFRFVLTGIKSGTTGWTGIGFGSSMHSGIDTIMLRLWNDQIFITDEYVKGHKSPSPDKVNNVRVYSTKVTDGVMVAAFSRSVHSYEQPYDASLVKCSPWKFIIGLNRMSSNGHARHHSVTPIHRIVCLDNCMV